MSRLVIKTVEQSNKDCVDLIAKGSLGRFGKRHPTAKAQIPGSQDKFKIPVVALIALILLTPSVCANDEINKEITDIGMVVCIVNSSKTRGGRFLIKSFFENLSEELPIGDQKMRLAVADGRNKPELVLKIAEGNTAGNVKNSTSEIQRKFWNRINRDSCIKNGVFKDGRKLLEADLSSSRKEAPKLYVGVTIFLTDAQKDKEEFEGYVQAIRSATGLSEMIDIFVFYNVPKTGTNFKNFYSGLFVPKDQDDCCQNDVADMTKKLVESVRRLLASCPLKVTEQCYSDSGKCLAKVEYRPNAIKDTRYCHHRPAQTKSCANPDGCKINPSMFKSSVIKTFSTTGTTNGDEESKGAMPITTSKPSGHHHKGQTPWGWLSFCFVSISICLCIVIPGYTYQILNFRRRQRARHEMLVEAGMVIAKKIKAMKGQPAEGSDSTGRSA